ASASIRLGSWLAAVQARPEIGSNSTTLALATSTPSTRLSVLMASREGFMVTPASDCLRARLGGPFKVNKQDEVGLRRRTLMTTGFAARPRNGRNDGAGAPGRQPGTPFPTPTPQPDSDRQPRPDTRGSGWESRAGRPAT